MASNRLLKVWVQRKGNAYLVFLNHHHLGTCQTYQQAIAWADTLTAYANK